MNALDRENLLIEIGCEELPAKNLQKLGASFAEAFGKALKESELSFERIEHFETPRRLALRVQALCTQQPARWVVKKGPGLNAAFDKEGQPTAAALGFAASCGVSIEQLSTEKTEKGAWLSFREEVQGQQTEALVPELLQLVLNQLPVGRRMRWGAQDFTFSRPIHWIVLLFGNQVIETTLYGLKTGRESRGHRFHAPALLTLTSPLEYEARLKEAFVMASFSERREAIINSIESLNLYEATFKHGDTEKAFELLEEATGLVEWPVVLRGQFEPSFLKLPTSVLITTLHTHQKCFPIFKTQESLEAGFLILSNLQSQDPKQVIAGNERVVHARLSDAAFYYKVDQETDLNEYRAQLKNILFQKGLSTLFDKTERMAALSHHIASQLGSEDQKACAEEAALLSKADLLTQMVGEFPELQGVMGAQYYQNAHPNSAHTQSVTQAILEHYYPRYAQDKIPSTLEGAVVALADKIDTLVGLFGIGKRPTGDKDPFGLRRQALGVIRILIETPLEADLKDFVQKAYEHYALHNIQLQADTVEAVLVFCFERLRVWYQEKGFKNTFFEAVHFKGLTHLVDFDKRMYAIQRFVALPEAESLASAHKRVHNLLSKINVAALNIGSIENQLLPEPAEQALYAILLEKEKSIRPLLDTQHYAEALFELAILKEPVDAFFNEVMVMVEEKALRENRLKLLSRLSALFMNVGDISRL